MVHHEMFYLIFVNFCDLFACGPTVGYTDPTPNSTAKELSLALTYIGPLHEAPASRLSPLLGLSLDAASLSPLWR